MADEIFISYSHQNREAARILADTIESQGYDVWWDRELIAGDDYTDKIEDLLDNAKAVIVLWSEHSRKSYWVRDEAAVGRDRNRLLPIVIDEVSPPLGFRQIHTINLHGWDGSDPAALEDLFAGLDGLLKSDQETETTKAFAEETETTNPFGAKTATIERKIAKTAIAAGVNAKPNNKPIKQILREEKKQRGFLRTFWLTSFIIAAIAAVIGGGLSFYSEDVMDETLSHVENIVLNGVVVFVVAGLGLMLGRFLIVAGRRLSKRKSVRYFDRPTLIAAGFSVAISLLFAWVYLVDESEEAWSVGDVLFYMPVFAFVLFFPFFSFLSVPIGAIKGVRRKSFQDGD